jgi:hypothetical protein
MLYLSQSLTENLGVEAFYQLEWDQTVIDNCGTFFAPSDTLADGCYQVGVGGSQNGAIADPTFVYLPRGADRDARDDGQFGVSFRYYAEQLNQTEFGLYFMNIHSRLPTYNTTSAGNTTDPTIIGATPNTQTGQLETAQPTCADQLQRSDWCGADQPCHTHQHQWSRTWCHPRLHYSVWHRDPGL